MKVHVPKQFGQSEKKTHILPLLDEDEVTVPKEDLKGFDIRVDPANDQPTYKMYVRILRGTESVRTVLRWVGQMKAALVGVAITS